jgi:hypothetical protein
MPIQATVTDTAQVGRAVDAWRPGFPSADLVRAAAALLDPYRVADRWSVPVNSVNQTASDALGVELFGRDPRREDFDAVGAAQRRSTVEGPRSYVEVGPGMIRLRTFDPVRADRSREAAISGARAAIADQAARLLETGDSSASCEPAGGSNGKSSGDATNRITSWSAKSRVNMLRTLASIDYSPLTASGRPPAMVTLTYPGRWEEVVPSADVMRRHLRALLERFYRAYGYRVVGVWKREFQRRGAPHLHLHMVPPIDLVNAYGQVGIDFREWLALSWVDIVGPSPVCDHGSGCVLGGFCPDSERARMLAAHRHPSVVDVREGMRSADPKRLSVYFTKHGALSAKEYQNEAPALWLADGQGIGRFWGVLGLRKAVSIVEVTDAERVALARLLRRWQRASNSYSAPRPVWRYSEARRRIDPTTGRVIRSGWYRRNVSRPVKRMRGSSGFLALNDGPGFLSIVAAYINGVGADFLASRVDQSTGELPPGT